MGLGGVEGLTPAQWPEPSLAVLGLSQPLECRSGQQEGPSLPPPLVLNAPAPLLHLCPGFLLSPVGLLGQGVGEPPRPLLGEAAAPRAAKSGHPGPIT